MIARPRRDAAKNDLRWRRTEKLLLKAFEQELGCTPLDKVKVVAVCETAEVSKAAFYAHYQDIYDLADAFVDAAVQRTLDSMGPATPTVPDGMGFVYRCVQALRSEEQKAFVRIADENRMMPRFLERICSEVEMRVSQGVSHPLNPSDRIAVTFILSGAIATVLSHPEVPDDVLADILARLMEQALGAVDHGKNGE